MIAIVVRTTYQLFFYLEETFVFLQLLTHQFIDNISCLANERAA